MCIEEDNNISKYIESTFFIHVCTIEIWVCPTNCLFVLNRNMWTPTAEGNNTLPIWDTRYTRYIQYIYKYIQDIYKIPGGGPAPRGRAGPPPPPGRRLVFFICLVYICISLVYILYILYPRWVMSCFPPPWGSTYSY